MSSFVVITEAPAMSYLQDYVALPKDYGSKSYFERPDIKAIRDTVFNNLNELNQKVGFAEQMAGKKVLIKPNLVSVFHKMGFKDDDYPESTDPRVFEAVVAYFKQFTDKITIIESSGVGVPTWLSYKVSGLDRVAKHYGIEILALEHQPVVRYMLPRAKVMKEVYIPGILAEVVRGEAFYVSVPKMKTNLYTRVTLGFKNAMGVIPYNLRQRNHNYLINKKLVDLLYLFKPDITIIDGIIGGEGCTPAPVDPVEVGVIISGNNSVETDRVAARMMGFDPDQIELMTEAVERGFNDEKVVICGKQKVVPFRPADPTFMNDRFKNDFPNVKVLVGHMKNSAPVIADKDQVTPDIVRQIEKACDGGCLAATKSSFEYMRYGVNVKPDFEMTLIFGSGILIDDQKFWFDRDGTPYSKEDIRDMSSRRVTVGECTRELKEFCEFNGEGCCSPLSCMTTPYAAVGKQVPLLTTRNKYIITALIEAFRNNYVRRKLIKAGYWLDCPFEAIDKIYELPQLNESQKQLDHIEWPLPQMTKDLKRHFLKQIKLIV